MILAVSVNRDSSGNDPWVTAVLPLDTLTGISNQPAYSVVVMTLTDGQLDSQEFRIVLYHHESHHEWLLICGRMASMDSNDGIFRGTAGTEDEAVSRGVVLAMRLATSPGSGGGAPG